MDPATTAFTEAAADRVACKGRGMKLNTLLLAGTDISFTVGMVFHKDGRYGIERHRPGRI